MTRKEKQKAIGKMSKEALEQIVRERGHEPTPSRPLAGTVHITGIGQVSVCALREELDRR